VAVKDLINDLHQKTALWLCRNFDVILLPTFETQQMTKNAPRFRYKTTRNMLTFAHYRFKQHLKFKASTHGTRVIEVNEAYTSRTASWSGEVKPKNSNRVIRSEGITLDRDVNGARGIMLRALRASALIEA